MTKEQYSSAKMQAEAYNSNHEIIQELNKGFASFFLRLPVPMSYELWRYLHKVKGDMDD